MIPFAFSDRLDMEHIATTFRRCEELQLLIRGERRDFVGVFGMSVHAHVPHLHLASRTIRHERACHGVNFSFNKHFFLLPTKEQW